jgi:hypothetical protein
MYGYYSVDQIIYHNKLDALLAGTKTGKQVFWHWHKEYNAIDWTSDSAVTVREIYKKRAQQLREKYDWIILSFSGGSDSWTVLNSFLSNGIHIDEIFCRWPLKATENLFTPNQVDSSTENILSEWEFAIKPVLHWLTKNHPNIKITIHDWSDEVLKTEFNDDYWLTTQDHLNPGYGMKYNAIGRNEKDIIESGKKTCIVFGIDKPQIWVKENKVFCYFLDILANTHAAPEPGRIIELFYWTKDMPEITHTQARVIYHHLCSNPNLAKLVDRSQPMTPEKKHIWDILIRGIVYPDYDLSTFQAKKDTSTIYSRVDSWMSLLPDQRFMQSWTNIINNLIGSIDDKFFNFRNGKRIGLSGFISPLYYLGDLPAENPRDLLIDHP